MCKGGKQIKYFIECKIFENWCVVVYYDMIWYDMVFVCVGVGAGVGFVFYDMVFVLCCGVV
jgi:hypothetical protein